MKNTQGSLGSETEYDSEATEYDSEVTEYDSAELESPLLNQLQEQDTFVVKGMSTTRYLGYEEISIPDWLKKNDLYQIGDWKAYKKTWKNGRVELKYAHRGYNRMFRSKADVKWVLERIVSHGREFYDGSKLQKRVADPGAQNNGNSSRSTKTICKRGRGRGTSLVYHDVDKLHLSNGNSSRSSKAVCTRRRGRGRGTSAVNGAMGNSSTSSMTISTRGRGRGSSAVFRAVDNEPIPYGFV